MRIWNPTVANLTLMALGSSAPEILLSVIELFGNGMYSGALGPSTIVGSAAFNLLMIIAVCVVSIPSGETRQVKEVGVYVCTAIASVVAYVWLIVMLEMFSPQVVEPWEGIVTFVAFPVLVTLSYLIDIGYFSAAHAKRHWAHAMISSHLLAAKNEDGSTPNKMVDAQSLSFAKQHAAVHPEVLAALVTEVEHDLNGVEVSAATLAELVAVKLETSIPKSRAYYRIQATRGLTGGKKLGAGENDVAGAKWRKSSNSAASKWGGGIAGYSRLLESVEAVKAAEAGMSKIKVAPASMQIACNAYVFRENCRTAGIRITRSGNTSCAASVKYATKSGTAKPGSDYTEVSGELKFPPHVTSQVVEINIIDDEHVEADEHFTLALSAPSTEDKSVPASLGANKTCKITIIDDDIAGTLHFATHSVKALESGGAVEVVVERLHGSTGTVSCSYYTADGMAIGECDYVPQKGTLTFHHGEASRTITIPLIDDGHYEKDEGFKIVLSNPSGGASFESGDSTEVCEVSIKSDDKKRMRVDEIASLVKMPLATTAFEVSASSWAGQFKDALNVNGGEDDDGLPPVPPTAIDHVLHLLCLPWKLLFAFIPPSPILDGMLAFVVSLIFIGFVTAGIGDIASLFGCVLGLPDAITAITFVAMGTSLPDTFASMSAAVNDATADASIVNVTGSNAVNVFLGLGLPWMIGAIYWAAKVQIPSASSRPRAATCNPLPRRCSYLSPTPPLHLPRLSPTLAVLSRRPFPSCTRRPFPSGRHSRVDCGLPRRLRAVPQRRLRRHVGRPSLLRRRLLHMCRSLPIHPLPAPRVRGLRAWRRCMRKVLDRCLLRRSVVCLHWPVHLFDVGCRCLSHLRASDGLAALLSLALSLLRWGACVGGGTGVRR